MYPSSSPICVHCARLDQDARDGVQCEAFPSGIPDEIFLRGYDHRVSFKGDNGILFEPKKD